MTVVDMHCHTFNAKDVAVREFLRDARGLPWPAPRLLEWAASGAPGYRAEREQLERLLNDELIEFEEDLASRLPSLEDIEQLRSGVTPEWMAPDEPELAIESLGGLREFFVLMRRYRWQLSSVVPSWFDNQVDLFTPLSVDLGYGLHKEPSVSIRDQLALQELISLASMRGKLPQPPGTQPGTKRARFHPFIGFDPRRPDGMAVVEDAILNHGFIGVKLYPPMDFWPDPKRNKPEDGERLEELYDFCCRESVPITTHTTKANAVDPEKDCANPMHWLPVVMTERFANLRLNLGHFGGAGCERVDRSGKCWREIALEVMDAGAHVYGDVGNHEIVDDDVRDQYFSFLTGAMEAHPLLVDRFMYASDWHFLTMHGKSKDFLDLYRTTYDDEFGRSATEKFMGANALRFLGFDDVDNANATRLRKRYHDCVVDYPDWLAAPNPPAP